MTQTEQLSDFPIKKLLSNLNNIFGNRVFVDLSEIISKIDNDSYTFLFPKVNNGSHSNINQIILKYFLYASDDSPLGKEYLLHKPNFKDFLINSIVDTVSTQYEINSNELLKIVYELIHYNYGIRKLRIVSGWNLVNLLSWMIEIAKTDNRIKLIENKKTEEGIDYIFQLNHFSILNIDSAIESYIASSLDYRISIRAILNRLNSSADLYEGFNKPIELSDIQQYISKNAYRLHIVESKGILSFNKNHPIVLHKELSSRRLSYYQLLSADPHNNYYASNPSWVVSKLIPMNAIFGVFVKNNQVFGPEFSEYLSTFPLVYVGTSNNINKFLIGGELFELKEDNEFAINLLSLLLHNKQAPVTNARFDLTFIKDNFDFAYNLEYDSGYGLIKFYKPLLNLKNNPENPFCETIWELKEKFNSEIKAMISKPKSKVS